MVKRTEPIALYLVPPDPKELYTTVLHTPMVISYIVSLVVTTNFTSVNPRCLADAQVEYN